MCIFAFCYTKQHKMLTIRTNEKTDLMIAYLRNHKVKFAPKLKIAIQLELEKMCKDFKMKEKRIKNAPDWLYD